MSNSKRISWVDNVKVIAIIFVALGHLYQSFIRSSILPNNDIYTYFNALIYCFHVPLFFICSGFLYQYRTKINSLSDYGKNIAKKLIAFGVPYFVFSAVSYLLKVVFSSQVNETAKSGFGYTLFCEPLAPYWFLYTLFFLFVVSPLIKNKADAIIRIAVAIALYFLYATVDFSFLPAFLQFIVESICRYSIWFVIGMCISAFDLHKYFKKPFGLFFVAFAILGTLLIKFSISFTGARLLLGLIACFGVINFIGAIYNKKSQTKIFAFLSKYTTPIFLMHTIFAAGVRIVLNKIGVDNAVIHVVAGLVASFGLPIIASVIMEKLRLDILYNPTKYIKIK